MECLPLRNQCEVFWDEIRNDSPNSFDQLESEDQLSLIYLRVSDADIAENQLSNTQSGYEQSRDPNALIFAIRKGSFKFADRILQTLKKSNAGSDIVLSTDSRGANSLQLFLSQMAENPNKGKSSISYELKESILNGLLSFDKNYELITNRDLSMKSAILQAVTCESQEFVAKWTSNLLEKIDSDAGKLAIIQNLEQCNCGNAGNKVRPSRTKLKHAQFCRVGFNLLMLALRNKYKSPSICIVQILKDLEENSEHEKEKSLVSLGREIPKFVQMVVPNSICVAAKDGNWDAMRTLLGFVSKEKQLLALLEWSGEEYLSALHWVLQADALHELKPILDVPDCLEEWSSILKRSVYWRKHFAYLEMSIDSMQRLQGLHEEEYLIPKPSSVLSRPLAMIFYNTFDGTNDCIKFAAKEAKDMEDAFETLGWGKDSIKTFGPRWTFDELTTELEDQLTTEKSIKRCSLFILVITTHGESGKIFGLDTNFACNSGRIEYIFRLIKRYLPDYIPKVSDKSKKKFLVFCTFVFLHCMHLNEHKNIRTVFSSVTNVAYLGRFQVLYMLPVL